MAASAGFSSLSVLSIVWNAEPMNRLSGQRWKGFFGAGLGGANLALGLSKIGDEGWKNQVVGVWNVAIGATAAFFGLRSLDAKPRSESRPAARLRVVPIAAAGSAPALGFQGHFRF